MTQMKRKTITGKVDISLDYHYDGWGSPGEFLEFLEKETESRLPDGAVMTKFVIEQESDYYGEDCNVYISVHWSRPETDEEMEKRRKKSERTREIARARRAKEKEKKEAVERATLKRLLDKYGSEGAS